MDTFYDDDYGDGLSRYPEQARLSRRARSPIPMVQREEYSSRLHEDFSDSGSGTTSDTHSERTSTVHLDRRHSRSDTIRGRSQEPVILSASSLSSGDGLATDNNYNEDRNRSLSGRTPSQVSHPMPIVDTPSNVFEQIPSHDQRSPNTEVRAFHTGLADHTDSQRVVWCLGLRTT